MLIARESFEQPIRAELFGVERLEQHAASLAAAQETKSGRGRRLLPRVEDNGRVLRESYGVIANAIREERVRGARLVIDPYIPRAWPGFELVFGYLSTRYDVTVENPRHVSRGVAFVEVDSVVLTGDHSLGLADDRNAHRVRIVLG